jgi:hypothetical protein
MTPWRRPSQDRPSGRSRDGCLQGIELLGLRFEYTIQNHPIFDPLCVIVPGRRRGKARPDVARRGEQRGVSLGKQLRGHSLRSFWEDTCLRCVCVCARRPRVSSHREGKSKLNLRFRSSLQTLAVESWGASS